MHVRACVGLLLLDVCACMAPQSRRRCLQSERRAEAGAKDSAG
jgi:hypothetical protein